MTGNGRRIIGIPSSEARRPAEGIPRPKGIATGLTVAAFLLLTTVSACDGGTPWSQEGRTISQETFVETMVELRLGAARTQELRLTRAQRERILERMDVTSDELVRFAEVHGGNVPFMAEVWDEIDARLRAKADLEEDDLRDGLEELVEPPVRGPGS